MKIIAEDSRNAARVSIDFAKLISEPILVSRVGRVYRRFLSYGTVIDEPSGKGSIVLRPIRGMANNFGQTFLDSPCPMRHWVSALTSAIRRYLQIYDTRRSIGS